MPIPKPLIKYLDQSRIKYEVVEHKTVYTAHDKAATLRVKPQMVGKTMIIVFDGKNYALGLIPANKNLDKKKVLAAFNTQRKKAGEKGYKKIDFAKEAWMKKTFEGIDVGATPPFSALYDLPFFVDNLLIKQTKIFINAGKYEFSFRISPANLMKLNKEFLKGGFSMAKKK
ncbi:MAG: YbaK/EbsC family protein [Candidatus Portnoybacteria bacterium]|nr:YbaK/EbsC family protein [Candidatus Portnoybacteria bacterium]